ADGRVLANKVGCSFSKQFLVFSEYEFHSESPVSEYASHACPLQKSIQSGSPNTRLAMMLSCISLVPPSMVLPRERSQSRVSVSSRSLKPGPSQPSAWGPAIDSKSS